MKAKIAMTKEPNYEKLNDGQLVLLLLDNSNRNRQDMLGSSMTVGNEYTHLREELTRRAEAIRSDLDYSSNFVDPNEPAELYTMSDGVRERVIFLNYYQQMKPGHLVRHVEVLVELDDEGRVESMKRQTSAQKGDLYNDREAFLNGNTEEVTAERFDEELKRWTGLFNFRDYVETNYS